MIRLMHPLALLLLLILPLLWWLWSRPARRTVIRFSNLALLRAAAPAWRVWLRRISPTLRSIALVCLIVAAARPQQADETSRIFAEGVAIQLVIDTSSSMLDNDLSPRGENITRLEVVKRTVRRFVLGDGDLPGRPNDLVGLVRFARYADSVCPLTLDRDTLVDTLEQTQITPPRSSEDGTAIGDGLALAVERLRDLQRTSGSGDQLTITSRVVILLTDGENNTGEVSPEDAGQLAAVFGIKVYTILAGTGQRVGRMRMAVDDSQLREIARVTGGKFFAARDPQSLASIYREIDQLERSKVEERRFERWGELSAPWLLAALLTLAAQISLEATLLRKQP